MTWIVKVKVKVFVKRPPKKRKIQILKYGCWVFKVTYDVALVFVYIPLWLRVSITIWNIKRLVQVKLLGWTTLGSIHMMSMFVLSLAPMVSQSRRKKKKRMKRKWIHKKLHVIFSSKPVLGCESSWGRAAVILIYIVAAILSKTVFLVDESSWSSIKLKSPLNAIVTPYVPGCLLWLFQFLPCSSISLKAIKLEETRTNEKSLPWVVFHQEKSILTAGCQNLLSPQLEGKNWPRYFHTFPSRSWG